MAPSTAPRQPYLFCPVLHRALCSGSLASCALFAWVLWRGSEGLGAAWVLGVVCGNQRCSAPSARCHPPSGDTCAEPDSPPKICALRQFPMVLAGRERCDACMGVICSWPIARSALLCAGGKPDAIFFASSLTLFFTLSQNDNGAQRAHAGIVVVLAFICREYHRRARFLVRGCERQCGSFEHGDAARTHRHGLARATHKCFVLGDWCPAFWTQAACVRVQRPSEWSVLVQQLYVRAGQLLRRLLLLPRWFLLQLLDLPVLRQRRL